MKIQMMLLLVFTAGIFLGTACEEAQPLTSEETTEADTTLSGPTWQLVAFLEGGKTQILVENLPQWGWGYTVKFTKQKANCDSGQSPCGKWNMKVHGQPNEGFFSYDFGSNKKHSLTIYSHGHTEVGQPEGSKETRFFDALKAATRYQINGKQLRISYGDEKVLLFEPLTSDQQ